MRYVFLDPDGAGRAGGGPSADLPERVRSAAGVIHYWTSGRAGERVPEHVPPRIDDRRAGELDEAWIPVHTPDGPGVLLWDNSE